MINQLEEYRKKLSKLTEEQNIKRDLYLKDFYDEKIQGPLTGFPSIDKPWLKWYSKESIDSKAPRMTAFEYLRECNKNFLNCIAIDFHGKITYREYIKRSYKAEKAFLKAGIKKGDYVTLCVPTLPETKFAFNALNEIGAVCNFIDPRMNKESIAEFINKTNSKLVVTLNDKGISEKVYSILGQTCAEKLIDIDGTALLNPIVRKLYYKKKKDRFICDKENTITWFDFIKSGSSISNSKLKKINEQNRLSETPEQRGKRVAAIVYTGGTSTGIPKGAKLTNDCINLPCWQYSMADIPRGKNDRFIDIMPPFIAYGLVDGMQLPDVLHMRSILLPDFNPYEFSTILKEYKPEHFVGIPLHYEILMADERCNGEKYPFIKNAGCGGEVIPVELEKAWNKFARDHGCPYMMRCGLGMTEHAAMSIYDINNKMTKEGNLGIPMQKMKIGVFDENGNELGYNETGELRISSEQIIEGYYNNEEETNNTIKVINGERWLLTKDNVSIDEDGNVKYFGRNKNMIIRPDGHNVWPERIAGLIYGCDIVKDACVVGIKSKHHLTGEIPTAIVVLNDQQMDKEEAKNIILEYQSHVLGERDGAIDVRFRESLPRTPIGKVDTLKVSKEENQVLSDMDFAVLTNSKKKVLKQ
jgi:long-chain acyl-CoA synthetase